MKNAEFTRTYRSEDFPGGALVRRLEVEEREEGQREHQQILPVPKASAEHAELRLRNFEDFYGFRGSHPEVFYLSPWEFLMLWEVRKLPKK